MALIMSPAFSVADFMATRRAICSLTAASRKHLNNRTLNDTGRISSKMPCASGMNSYSTFGPAWAAGAEVGGEFRDLARVRLGLAGTVHRLLEARGCDQFHRPRDLADVLDRLP